MEQVEIVLVLMLVSVAVFAAAARAMELPYPIVLVVGGLALGFLPGLPDVELDPELVLVIFLPPLLYSAAFFASLRDLRADIRSISMLAIGLVLATMGVVAVVAHALIPDLSWQAAFALGAIVSPTDPVAATTIARRLAVPRRIINILEGESLINDGTALVAYRLAVAGATVSVWNVGFKFVGGALGGVAIGLAVAWVITWIRARIDDIPVEITISLLSGYAGYVPAERAGCSGVLAAVTVGIYLGWQAPRVSTASMRLQGYAVWEILVFFLNALLFVLIGLQLPLILDELSGESAGTLLAYAAAVSLAVIGTRIAWLNTGPYIVRALDRRPRQVARRVGWRMRMITAWSGMRGAVSLAAALALPTGFPQRTLILFLTFCVILTTLVLQGLTLPLLIRRLAVGDDGAEKHEELVARLRATEAALTEIDQLEGEDWTREDTVERMRGLYSYRRTRLKARAGKVEDDGYEERSVSYQTMVHRVLDAQRDTVVRLRNEGVISNDVMHRVERELDLEEERLEI